MNACYRVPGRVELVGKHVDYAGGPSLTCAIEQGLTVRAHPLERPVVRLRSDRHHGTLELDWNHPEAPVGHWGTYAAAVMRRLKRDFICAAPGLDLIVSSDLPEDAGLSSSSALVIAVASALADRLRLNEVPEYRLRIPDRLAQAEYFAALETGAAYRDLPADAGVGVAGGAQDHVAILCARANHCGLYHYLPARAAHHVPWPHGQRLAIAVSGVRANKIGSARDRYNRTAGALRALLDAWNRAEGTNLRSVAAALESGHGAREGFARLATAGVGGFEPRYLLGRFQQFLDETEVVVPTAANALAQGDLRAFAAAVARSQSGAETGLQNQVPETIALARIALIHNAVAASAFGAGFGGAVWAMVPERFADSFLADWRQDYLSAFPERATDARFFWTRPGAPADRGPHGAGQDSLPA